MERVAYLNQPNCYKLSNGTVELIVTTDVGPRIIRYGFVGGDNMLGEVPEASVKTALGEWKPFGGHRLWLAPESLPRSYVPDSAPVEFTFAGERTIRLRPAVETPTGIGKELTVALDDEGAGVTVTHRITNHNLWAVEVAPWALTIMSGGGEAILPQEPYLSWDECVLPARALVLWHYTDLADPRWRIGGKFIRLRVDEQIQAPQKVGITNKQGWAAYQLNGTLFVKRFDYKEGATYPDYNSNTQIYTAGSFVEVESLAHLRRLEPGESAEHVERWSLFPDVPAATTEDELDAAISPLVAGMKV